jgi:hypothetical protein
MPDESPITNVDMSQQVQPDLNTLPVTSKSEKLDSRLAAVANIARGGDLDAAIAEGNQRGLDMVGSDVRVVVVAGPASDPAVLESALTGLGALVESRYETLTQALVPVAALPALETLGDVTWVRPPIPATPTQ